MKLSDFKDFGLEVLRDAEFDIMAKLTDTFDKRALCALYNEEFADILVQNPNIAAVITDADSVTKIKNYKGGIAVAVSPKVALIQINNSVIIDYAPTRIGKSCNISPKAQISERGVVIGDSTIIEDGVVINSGTTVGCGCIIRRGCVLGGDSYENCRDQNDHYIYAEHKGRLVIGNDVYIESEAIVDKALFSWGATTIGDNCYIGRRAVINHGCTLSRKCRIAAEAMLCGYVSVGDGASIGIRALVANRKKIGDNADVKLGSVVTKDVDIGCAVSGNFAINHELFLKHIKKISDKME